MRGWIALSLLLPATALAGETEAGRLFDEGQQAMTAKDYATACSKFAASLRLDPGIGTRLWLADCYEQADRLASAWRMFREAAAAATEAKDTRADVAKSRAAKLEPALAKLVFKLENPPPGLEIRLDGVKLEGWSSPVFVDRGRHEVLITGKPLRVIDVDADGTSYPVVASFAAPGPGLHELRETTAWPYVGWSLVSVGAASIGVGTLLGLRARSLYDGAANDCPSTCNSEGYAQRNSAFRAASASTIVMIAGGAVTLAGITVLIVAPHSAVKTSVKVGAASLTLEATF